MSYRKLLGITCQAHFDLPDQWLKLSSLLALSSDKKGKECLVFLLMFDFHKP